MKISDIPKREPFIAEGIKSHRLWQYDNAVLIITEIPSEVVYTLDYFQWHAIMKSTWKPLALKEIVLQLSNQEEVVVDYDNQKVYTRARTHTSVSGTIAQNLHETYTTGNNLENP